MGNILVRTAADKRKRMTSPGVVALACVRCASGYLVPPLSHPRAEPMSKEQLDAVRDQLLAVDVESIGSDVVECNLCH